MSKGAVFVVAATHSDALARYRLGSMCARLIRVKRSGSLLPGGNQPAPGCPLSRSRPVVCGPDAIGLKAIVARQVSK